LEKYKLESDKTLLIARWIGLILIVLGWFQVIPLLLGWIGFGIACISFILESIYKKNLPPPKTGGNPEEQPPDPDNKN
jgi:hypothetical protein